jgi:hypothetical protein
MLRLGIALGGILFVTTLLCHAADRHSRDRAYIEQAESDWAEMTVTNDAAVLERILADDFVGVATEGGKHYTKADAIAETKTPSEYVSNHLSDVKIRFYGNTAVAQGSEYWKKKDGKSGKFVWTDTWVKRDGKWQIVAAQDNAVPD